MATNGNKPPAGANLTQRIAWVQAKVGAVDKTGKISFGQTKYDYMQEHGLLSVLKPLLEAAELSYAGGVAGDRNQPFERDGNRITVLYELEVAHKGESKTYYSIGEGVDPADKGSAKAMTMANKYALQKVFQVPTENIDDADRTSTKEHEEKKEAAKPKPPTKKNLEAVVATAKDAAEKDYVSQNRISANLQQSFGVTKIQQLDAKQLKAFAGWLTEELKKSKSAEET